MKAKRNKHKYPLCFESFPTLAQLEGHSQNHHGMQLKELIIEAENKRKKIDNWFG